jgi:hypothetical protein
VRRGNGARTDSAGRGLTGRQAGSSLAAIPVSLPARGAVLTVFDVGPSPNAQSKSKSPAILAARNVSTYAASFARSTHLGQPRKCSSRGPVRLRRRPFQGGSAPDRGREYARCLCRGEAAREFSKKPAAFHKNAFRSGIDKSLLVLFAAARSRLGGAARFRERRWHGTDATLRLRCQRRQCRP